MYIFRKIFKVSILLGSWWLTLWFRRGNKMIQWDFSLFPFRCEKWEGNYQKYLQTCKWLSSNNGRL
jgi:hypothetical protein